MRSPGGTRRDTQESFAMTPCVAESIFDVIPLKKSDCRRIANMASFEVRQVRFVDGVGNGHEALRADRIERAVLIHAVRK